jgi:hypothetical protein
MRRMVKAELRGKNTEFRRQNSVYRSKDRAAKGGELWDKVGRGVLEN